MCSSDLLIALLLVAHEVDHHIGLVIAHGDGDIALVYDAEGHRGVRRAGAYLLDIRNTKDDEHPSVVVLVTGALVGIADVGEEIVGYVEFIFQIILVFIGRTSDLYPTVGLPFADGLECRVDVPKSSHTVNLHALNRPEISHQMCTALLPTNSYFPRDNRP